MNAKQAEYIPLTHYLAINGFSPFFVNANKAIYPSPFQESGNTGKTHHLVIDRTRNTWYDTTTNTKGTLLELIVRIQGISQIGALLYLQYQNQLKISTDV